MFFALCFIPPLLAGGILYAQHNAKALEGLFMGGAVKNLQIDRGLFVLFFRTQAFLSFLLVTFVGPGEIRHAGIGETVLGAWSHVREADLVRFRNLLADVGIVASVTSDIRTELWSKLVVNASPWGGPATGHDGRCTGGGV